VTRVQAAGDPAGAQRSVLGWPSVSVVVPVHRGGETFRRCLESLRALDPHPREVIVAVDGADETACSLAAEYGARVTPFPVRSGPARARNVGARESSGDILFFVDADVELRPDAIARVGAEFRQDPGVAAVFGSYDDDPAERNLLSQYKNLQHHWIHQTGREEAFTFWAGCGAVRREVFEAVGGFDEAYEHPSVEDIELGYRIRAAGRRIRLLKDLQCKHLKRWGAVSLLEADVLYRAIPGPRSFSAGRGS
jgi:GT2 family glycosyltransferase